MLVAPGESMTDEALMAAMHGLGLDDDNVHAIVLLPLIEVAWADGRVHENERRLILDIARQRGVLSGEGSVVLETWLRYRPSDRYLARGREVLNALALREAGGVTSATLQEIVGFCERVALSAAGLFGRAFKAINPEEKAAIAEIATALAMDRKATWAAVEQDLKAAQITLRDDITSEDPFGIPDETDPGRFTVRGFQPVEGPLKMVQAVRRRTRDNVEGPVPAVLVRLKDGHESSVHRVGGSGITIGRRSDNDIVIAEDAQVSRQHCRVFLQGQRYYVVDCASASGTWVNGERVHERRLLGSEDLQIGQTHFLVTLGVLRD